MDKFMSLGFRVYEGSERTTRKKEYGSPVRKNLAGWQGTHRYNTEVSETSVRVVKGPTRIKDAEPLLWEQPCRPYTAKPTVWQKSFKVAEENIKT